MKKVLKSLTFAILSSIAVTGFAESGHDANMNHGSHDAMQAQPKMFLEKSEIDGHTVGGAQGDHGLAKFPPMQILRAQSELLTEGFLRGGAQAS